MPPKNAPLRIDRSARHTFEASRERSRAIQKQSGQALRTVFLLSTSDPLPQNLALALARLDAARERQKLHS
jgi:hypothetical protein